MHDGPSINVWDGLAIVAWVVATGLIVYDEAFHGDGMGPLTPFGGLVVLMASVLTAAGIARRAKEEILAQMQNAFDLGQESVRRLRP